MEQEHLYEESKGCDKCTNAKKAFLLLNKVGFEDVGVM